MKKFLSVLLAIAILMSMAVPAMAAEETAEVELVTEEIVTTETEETPAEEVETEEVSAEEAENGEVLTESTEEVAQEAANNVTAAADDEYEIPFDELLFVASVASFGVEAVSYYENETPVLPAIMVAYKDGTSGALPENIRVVYPTFPTEPGTYRLELLVANKYYVPFDVTVLAAVQAGPTAKLDAPVVAVARDKSDADVLSWDAVEYASYYEIYRATSKTSSYTKIDKTEDHAWVCENVPTDKTYYYKVVAVYADDVSLNSDQSEAVSVVGRCARPEITLKVASTGKPALSWNKVSGAKKYEIYRALVDDVASLLPIDNDETGTEVVELEFKLLTTTKSTSYTDTSAKTGLGYAYRIRVLGSKAANNSAYSETVETICFMTTPVLSVKTDAATGKPMLSWKKITGAAYYVIGRMVPGGNPEMLDLDNYEFLDMVSDGLSYLDASAEIGNEYTYVMAAMNGSATEYSYASNIVKAKCVCAKPAVKGSLNDNGAPVLTWEAVEFAENYLVYRSTKADKSYSLVQTVTEPTYTDASVAAGKTYYYKVVAVAGSTKSAESAYVKLTGKCATPELTVSAGSTGKPVLTWNKVNGAKKYEIWRSVDGATFKKLTTVTKTTYTDTKATNGAECTYKVKALGSKSTYNGNFSEVGGCKVICAAPTLTAKVDTASGKPSLSWSKVTGATGYAIYRNGELLTTITGVSYLDTTAETDAQYSYYVVSVGKTEDFNSIASATKTVTATVGQPKIKGTVNEDGKPVITWDAVEDAVKYVVYRSTSSSKSYKEIATITDLTYVDTSVAAGKTYYYKVMAVGQTSKGAQSDYAKVTGKCAQPVAEATLNAKTGKPVITWEKVSGAKKYDVYRATSVDGKYSKIGTATKTTYTDSKASVGTTYYYKVVAVGSKTAYNSIQSAATEAIPTLIAQPSVTVKNDTKTGAPVVSWGKVSGATEYIVMYADVTDFMESENGPDDAYLEENMKYVTTTKTTVTLTDAEVGHVYLVTMVAVPKAEEFFSVPTDPEYVAATCVAPKITSILSADGKPAAYWDDVEGAEGYIVYRSTKSGSGYKAIGVVFDAFFIDDTAAKGKTYYYKVTAATEYTESAMSNSVKIKSK